MNQDHQAFARAALGPAGYLPSRSRAAGCALRDGFIIPAGMLGADGGGTRGLRMQVHPVSCQQGRAAYAAAIIEIPGPTG